jgi:hypothetical protein
MSIEQAKKTVENVQSWDEARLYARKRIKDLQFSLKVFEKMIKDGVPRESGENSTSAVTDATRN